MAIKKEQLRYAADMHAALLYAGLTGKNGEGAVNYALSAARKALAEGRVLEQLAEQASVSGDLLGAAALRSTDPNSLDTNMFSAMLKEGHRNYVQGLDVPSYLAHLKSALGYAVPKDMAEEVAKELGGPEATVGRVYSQLEQAEENALYEELTAKREKREPVVDKKKLARLQRRREIVDLLMGQALKTRGGTLDDLVARDRLGKLLKEDKQA